jgi:protein-L-isoaspartate(D-aspartate) O-methyltransferase
MNIEQARFNMVEQQIRPWEVLDQEVLDLLLRMRREEFVPEAYRALAFADMEIPLGHGELMLSPKMEGRILQTVEPKKTDKVLEVGTGSGYLTALLALSTRFVCSVEIVPEFSEQAAQKLKTHGIDNVTLEVGDAARGWQRTEPFDVIVLTGSVPVLSVAFQNSLAIDGRLFAVVGEAPVMRAKLITRVAPNAFHAVELFETCLAPLINAQPLSAFVF